MVRNPEVQKKAQREIDLHIGSSRLPSFKDRPNLPYVVALAKEVLRWHAVAPQGVQSTLISFRLEVNQMRIYFARYSTHVERRRCLQWLFHPGWYHNCRQYMVLFNSI